MIDDLSNLSAPEIDALPFGYIALAPDGTVRKYNRYEADLARKDPREVLGRNFFTDVAPCTQVHDFEGRFREFVEAEGGPPTLSFDFLFRFRHGTQKVHVGFVRSPLKKEVIVTVNRRRDKSLAVSAELTAEPARGILRNAAEQRVVTCGDDFWHVLESLFEGRGATERAAGLHRMGRAWARRHLHRVEALVQREHGKALREVELQVALEALSGSLGAQGLGLFDVDFQHRKDGLMVVEHRHSPFAAALDGGHSGDGHHAACHLLAGLHAGFFSHLAGRELVAREVQCSRRPEEPCRLVVGTEERLRRLAGSRDGAESGLRRHLGFPAPVPANSAGSGDVAGAAADLVEEVADDAA